MKYCSKCGAPCADNADKCPECGNIFSETGANPGGGQYQYGGGQYQSGNQNQYGNGQYQYGDQNQYGGSNSGGMQYQKPSPSGFSERSIPLAILFSLITCGIYTIYWIITLNDEINYLSGEDHATSGGVVFLLTIVTCGIYGLYWAYKMGERCDRINFQVNGNSNILYLVIAILGFSIVNYCLMQDTINRAVRAQQGR